MLEFGMPTLIENKTLEDNIALCKKKWGYLLLN